MTIIGSFDPSVETYPSGSVSGSPNLVPNSSAELSWPNPGDFIGDIQHYWDTSHPLTGDYCTRVQVRQDLIGSNHWTFRSVNCPGGVQHYGSVYVYVVPGSPMVGKTIGIAYTTTLTAPVAWAPKVLVGGWNRLSMNMLTDAANYLVVGAFDSSTLPHLGEYYLEHWQCSVDTGSLDPWQPANGEPLFKNGQQWAVTGTGTFQGQLLSVGDILTCTGSSDWRLYDATTWEVTQFVSGVAANLQTKPPDSHGTPMGYGDWRYAVQVLLPTDTTSRWGVAKWGEATWSGKQWYDITGYVRGMEWTRGTTTFGGRPEVGVATLTLDNEDNQFSPWNGVSSFQGAAVMDSTGIVFPGYLAPGTLMRSVCFSPSGMVSPTASAGALLPDSADSWVPQFTGIVESWTDESFGLGKDSHVTVVVKETLSTMALVDDLALSSAVGNDDTGIIRVQRLLDNAGWPYGDVDDSYFANAFAPGSPPLLQSTVMAGNRISEVYLTADSVGGVVRSDRSGKPLIYNVEGTPYGVSRGPDRNYMLQLSHAYVPGGTGASFSAPYIADSTKPANDDDIIINDVTMSYVGGSVRTGQNVVSQQQYGRRTYSRTDLICKTDTVVDYLIEKVISTSNTPLRLASLQVHNLHAGAYPAIIGLDIDNRIDVELPPLPGYTVKAPNCQIAGYTHNVTPLPGGLVWTTDITFGVQDPITMEETP